MQIPAQLKNTQHLQLDIRFVRSSSIVRYDWWSRCKVRRRAACQTFVVFKIISNADNGVLGVVILSEWLCNWHDLNPRRSYRLQVTARVNSTKNRVCCRFTFCWPVNSTNNRVCWRFTSWWPVKSTNIKVCWMFHILLTRKHNQQ